MGYMHTTATGRAAAQLKGIAVQRRAYEESPAHSHKQKRTVPDCKGCGAPLTSHEATCSYCARPNPEYQ